MASTKTFVGRAKRVLILRKKSSEQSLNPTERTEYRDLRIIMATAGINTDLPARKLIRYAQIVDHGALVNEYCKLSSRRSDRRSDRKALKRAANELRDVGINPDKSLKQALGKINNNARTYASEQKKHSKQQLAARAAQCKTVKRMPNPNPNRRPLFA